MSIPPSEASKELATIRKVAGPVNIKAEPEMEASSRAFTRPMTEKAFQPSAESPSPCMNAVSSKEATNEETSPTTETDLSEPRTGTTTASFRTRASSPTFSCQDLRALGLQQRASVENVEDIPSITHVEALQAYSSLDFASLTKELKDIDELVINYTQERRKDHFDHINGGRDHINGGRFPNSTSMWVNTVADPNSTPPAPEFRPQPFTDEETGRVFEDQSPNMLLAKATSTPVYNPLAVEWCPGSQRNDFGEMLVTHSQSTPQMTEGFLEAEQTHSDRPGLTVEMGEHQPFNGFGRPKCLPMLKSEKEARGFQFSTGGSDGIPTRACEKSTLTATMSGMESFSSSNTIEEPSQDGLYTARHYTAPSDKTHLHDRPTLAQRRADRHLANAQIRLAQAAPSTAKPPPASLYIGREPDNTNKINVRSAPATGIQPGQTHLVSYSQSLTWKRLPNSDLESLSIHPEFARWIKVEQDLLRMGLIKRFPGKSDGGSFVVPKNFEQWLEFRAGRTEDLLLQGAAMIHSKNSAVEAATRACQKNPVGTSLDSVFDKYRNWRNINIGPAMGGKEYHDGCCTVLAHPSTWSPWYKPTEDRPEALWPCSEEMKEEGDERHTSAFGRFLALPRVPGNPTVVWKVKPIVPALPFDEVWKVPNKETWADLHSQKPDHFQDNYMKGIVGQSLLDAIDC